MSLVKKGNNSSFVANSVIQRLSKGLTNEVETGAIEYVNHIKRRLNFAKEQLLLKANQVHNNYLEELCKAEKALAPTKLATTSIQFKPNLDLFTAILGDLGTAKHTEVAVSVIFASLACCRCNKVKKNLHRVVCDGSIICWSCAVLTFTSTRKCWVCQATPVNTKNHIIKDASLAVCVKEYYEYGSLNKHNLQTLKSCKLNWKENK